MKMRIPAFPAQILPEKAFLIIGLIFGLSMVFITPPFQVPDEYNHFYRAFQISEGVIIAEKKITNCYGYSQDFSESECLGGRLPKSLLTTVRNVSEDLRSRPEKKQNFTDILALVNLPLQSQERIFINFKNTALYSPVPYFPQVIGIIFGRLFNFSPLLLMYAGRSFNFLIWLIFGYFSIQIVPFFKWVFFLLLLTPMCLFIAASLSADTLTNAISFLIIALFLRLAFCKNEENYQKQDIKKILVLSPILALSKQAYLPLLFCFFLIYPQKFKNLFSYFALFTASLFLGIITTTLWSLSIKNLYVPLIPNSSPSQQLTLILSNPLKFLETIIYTIAQNGLNYIEQFVGVLGWLDTFLPTFQIGSYLMVLVLVGLLDCKQNLLISRFQKIFVFLVVCLNVFLIMLLAYFWTPVGANLIYGLQGRYLIPLSPLILLLFYQEKFYFRNFKMSFFVILYALFSGTSTLATLINRYY